MSLKCGTGLKILVLNSGSSSLKASLYVLTCSPSQPIPPLWEGSLQWKGRFDDVWLESKSSQGVRQQQKIDSPSIDAARIDLMNTLVHGQSACLASLDEIDVIGHRVVHGGRFYRESVRIDVDVTAKIYELAAFAPLHNLAAIHSIEAMGVLLKNKPQIAVFDTAFHHSLPKEATIYPGPYKWFEQGIQRYGFHGISYQYCSRRSAAMLGRHSKTVICHLGSGASLCAVDQGKSIDTTMGFTPLEGLMMNTRSGTIDPGIILQRLEHTDSISLSNELYRESGLLGVSGVSSDMREILTAIEKGNSRAQLAWDLYLHRLCSCIGSMIASLQGIETLVFTAGIGENTPLLRRKTCERFAFTGIQLDDTRNETPPKEDCDIARKSSAVRVLLIHTQEAFEIACECWRLTQVHRRKSI
jgi:acetate kinase